MREPYTESLANCGDPESCVAAREGRGEALTGACMGTVLSREITHFREPTSLIRAEGNTRRTVNARCVASLRGRRPVARAEPLRARTERSHPHPLWMAWRVASGRPKATSR